MTTGQLAETRPEGPPGGRKSGAKRRPVAKNGAKRLPVAEKAARSVARWQRKRSGAPPVAEKVARSAADGKNGAKRLPVTEKAERSAAGGRKGRGKRTRRKPGRGFFLYGFVF